MQQEKSIFGSYQFIEIFITVEKIIIKTHFSNRPYHCNFLPILQEISSLLKNDN